MARTTAEIADLLAAGQFDSIRDDFDDTMKAQLSTRRLRRAWRLMKLLKGRYLGVSGAPTQTNRDGVRVVDLPLHYRRSDAKLRVAYSSEGRIAGLFILNPEVV